MYKGFELSMKSLTFPDVDFDEFLNSGKKRYKSIKKTVEDKINSFVLEDGKLDGTKMQANWFPRIDADIFISHSHDDEDLAIVLSEWLYREFGLSVFIDSLVWGYGDELLKLIDNEYCLNSSKKTYSYTKRNYSTSHVHMMLSTALTKMIDKSECVFFLNTPNSITPDEVIARTKSPWIYSEIEMTALIRQKSIDEHRLKKTVLFAMFNRRIALEKAFKIEYALNTDHLIKINPKILEEWEDSWNFKGERYNPNYTEHALDCLYKIISNKNKNGDIEI